MDPSVFEYYQNLEKAIIGSLQSNTEEQKMREEQQKQQQLLEAHKAFVKLMEWEHPELVEHGRGATLENIFNSCFMNAVLQCLAYTPGFAQYLCQSHHVYQCQASHEKRFCVLCEVEILIREMHSEKGVLTPANLFCHLKHIGFSPGLQHDAGEFLRSLLGALEKAYDKDYQLQRNTKKPNPMNPIRKLFCGSTRTKVTCANCQTVTQKEEPFRCLSIPVDNGISLMECLAMAMQSESLNYDNKFFCNRCERKCVASKRSSLSRLPPYLVFHLKRFRMEFDEEEEQLTLQKSKDIIKFPSTLDLKQVQSLIFDEDKQRVLIDSRYELYAMLVHTGQRLASGHYYALVKCPDGTWHKMNDSRTVPVSLKQVLKEQGYVVFYRRKSHQQMNQMGKW